MEAKELTGLITDYLNTFSNEKKNQEFCDAMSYEHRTLQQNFTGLCLAWIQYMGNDTQEFKNRKIDGRNEFSNEVCTMLHKFMTEQGIQSNLPCI